MTKKKKILIGVLVLFMVFGAIIFYFFENDRSMLIEPIEKQSMEPPSNEVKQLDKILAKMEFGNIAFNVPTNINIDDSPQIKLVLSLTETVETLKKLFTEEAQKKVGASIKVSPRMKAHLSGRMFDITKVTPEIQAVSEKELTEWKWEIHPKKAGKHTLYLTLSALLEIEGTNTPHSIKTFDKEIAVNVTTMQEAKLFFNDNWQWLWMAIFVPVAGWLWQQIRKQPTNN